MALVFDNLDGFYTHGFDTVIDVRSPAEFAEDHVPGAINLPVLSNEERARVGTIYKQQSPFLARKIGAALVARNSADHVAGVLADRDGGWRPLIYCWRGGQRSGFFTHFLKEIGWRAEVVQGGYQTYRRMVYARLYAGALPIRAVLLDGYTGTAKTEILARLRTRGVQVIDLEGLARHRGSLLGSMPGGQPDQKWFETELALALSLLDPARPVVLEAESSKIGRIVIPPALWKQMCAAPRITIDAPLIERAAYTAQAYAEILTDTAALTEKLAPLRRLRGHEPVDAWIKLSAEARYAELSASLMADHYDPAYAKSSAAHAPVSLGRIEAATLDNDGQERAADRIAALVKAL